MRTNPLAARWPSPARGCLHLLSLLVLLLPARADTIPGTCWSDQQGIFRSDLNGANVMNIVTHASSRGKRISVNDDHVYRLNPSINGYSIWRSNQDGR